MLYEAVGFSCIYLILSTLLGVSFTVFLMTVHLVIAPLLFKFSKAFQQQLVFLNYIQWPIYSDFTKPSERGLEGGRNFYIKHLSKVDSRKIRIGVWHILPKSVLKKYKEEIDGSNPQKVEEFFNHELITSGRPIFLYCHGNANHRAARHRVKLYQLLQSLDAHCIAFDYRGYGDSSFVLPTEAGVVEDSLVVYDWLQTLIDTPQRPRVYVWGHSLGTGISSHLLGNLRKLSEHYGLSRVPPLPDGLILETPFSNLRDEVDGHFMIFMVRWLPYFESSFVEPFSGDKRYEFLSDQHLRNVNTLPILILHAEDDMVVPYRLGVKLYEAVSRCRGDGDAPVVFRGYSGSRRLGHVWICMDPDTPAVLTKFMEQCSKFKTHLVIGN